MRKVRAQKPDVAIVDIRMPPGNADDGLRAAHRRQRLSHRRIFVSRPYRHDILHIG